MKFCAKCGKEIPEGVKFCPGCGAPIQSPEPAAGVQKAPSKTSPKVLIGAAAAAAVVAVVVIAVKLFSGGNYKQPIENLEKGLNEQDLELVAEAFVEGELPSTEIFDAFESLGGLIDYEVKLEIESEEKLDKDEIKEVLTEEYDVEDRYARKASAAYILDIEMTMTIGEYSEEESTDLPVAKIDGKWVIPADISEML